MGTIYKNLGFENITDSFGIGDWEFFKTKTSQFASKSRANTDLEINQDRTSLHHKVRSARVIGHP